MIVRKRNKVDAKQTMLLVCANEAEAIFFSQLRKDCRYSNLTVVAANGITSLEKLLDYAGKLRNKGKYTSCWAVFGLDEVGATRESVNDAEELALKKKIKMLYFEPSFDLYFSLFFAAPNELIEDIEKLKENVKSHIDGYELSSEYFLTKGLNLNFTLYPKLAEADKNARSYNEFVSFDRGYDVTSLPLFFDDLKEVCGKADMSHSQKNRR